MIARRVGQGRSLQEGLVHGKQVGVVRWVELIEEERAEAMAKVAQHAAPLPGCGRDQAADGAAKRRSAGGLRLRDPKSNRSALIGTLAAFLAEAAKKSKTPS